MSSWRRTALGVDVDVHVVRLALVEAHGREAVVRRLVEAPIPDAALDQQDRVAAAVVAKAIRQERLAADAIVAAVPAASALIRRLHVPVTGRAKVRAALAFAMEPLIPYPAEDIYVDGVEISTEPQATEVLAFALRRDVVAQRVKAFQQAGAPADVIAPDLLPVLDAIPNGAVDAGDREAVVYVRGDRGFFAVRQAGRLLDYRALQGGLDSGSLRRDVLRSLMTVVDDGTPLARVLLLGDAAKMADVGARADIVSEVLPLQLPARVSDSVAAGVGDTAAWEPAICLGAHGLGRGRHLLNFCQGDLAQGGEAAWGLHLQRLALLAGVTLLAYAGSLFVQRWALREDSQELRRAAQQAFAGVLPAVSSVEAARSKLEEGRVAYRELAAYVHPAPGPLEVLAACDAAIRAVPKVEIESLTLTGDILRLSGRVADFQAVTTLEHALASSPMLIEVKTNQADVSRRESATSFRISARVRPDGDVHDIQLPAALAPRAPTPAAPAEPAVPREPSGPDAEAEDGAATGRSAQPVPEGAAPAESAPDDATPADAAEAEISHPAREPLALPAALEPSGSGAPPRGLTAPMTLDELFARHAARAGTRTADEGEDRMLFRRKDPDHGT